GHTKIWIAPRIRCKNGYCRVFFLGPEAYDGQIARTSTIADGYVSSIQFAYIGSTTLRRDTFFTQAAEVMRLRTLVLVFVATFVAATMPARAQERFGGLSGVVTDPSAAAIPGATVTVTNKQTGATRFLVTSADGSYRFQDLEPGRYAVAVELSGFTKAEAQDVLVLLGKTIDFSPKLQVGAVSETVNVTAEAEKQIDLKSVTLAHNI